MQISKIDKLWLWYSETLWKTSKKLHVSIESYINCYKKKKTIYEIIHNISVFLLFTDFPLTHQNIGVTRMNLLQQNEPRGLPFSIFVLYNLFGNTTCWSNYWYFWPLTLWILWKSKIRVTSSNPRVGRLKARIAWLKARVGRLKARAEAIKPRLR